MHITSNTLGKFLHRNGFTIDPAEKEKKKQHFRVSFTIRRLHPHNEYEM